ncbi:hypothetical protein HOY82DRAFT_537815 [Tuber indicum]|nr:hypothetical protein HOY82DRAFT_537815 [Tuber indicum]
MKIRVQLAVCLVPPSEALLGLSLPLPGEIVTAGVSVCGNAGAVGLLGECFYTGPANGVCLVYVWGAEYGDSCHVAISLGVVRSDSLCGAGYLIILVNTIIPRGRKGMSFTDRNNSVFQENLTISELNNDAMT